MTNLSPSASDHAAQSSAMWRRAAPVFVAVAVLYAASGVIIAGHSGGSLPLPQTAAGLIHAAGYALLPSLVAVAVLWLAQTPRLHPPQRRAAVAVVVLAAGCFAFLAALGSGV